MKTLQKQISLFTEDELTSFPEGSHANRFQSQESSSEQKTNAIYGRKCLEEFGKFSRAGLWAKTFAGLLIGMEGWYSSRCRLIWKLKGTKFNRLYFQLVPSTPRTEGTGSGLLPTPTVMDTNKGDLEKIDKRRAKALAKGINGNGFGMTIGELANRRMLPTPQTQGLKVCNNRKTEFMDLRLLPTPTASIAGQNGQTPSVRNGTHGINLSGAIHNYAKAGMLPTPTSTSDVKGGCTRKDPSRQNDTLAHAIHGMEGTPGKTSQLNPRFVMEMMGFPPSWCDNAFEKIAWDIYQKKKSTKSFQKRIQNGGMKQLKPAETR